MTQYERPSPYEPRMTTTIPPMFAIMASRSDSVSVFDAVPVTEHPYDYHNNAAHRPAPPSQRDGSEPLSGTERATYLIIPHRFYQRDNLPSFTIPDRPANHYMPAVTLVAASPQDSTRERDRRVIFHGECRPSEASVYTVYHPAGIPIYVFECTGRVDWPINQDNVLRVFPGDRTAYRFWLHRWDPDTVFENYSSVRNRYDPTRPAPRPPAPQPPVPQLQPSCTTPLPTFVSDALIQAAVTKEATCPITMEPITAATATVTPCYHVFDKIALVSWTAAGNTTCPTCKHRLAPT